MKDLNKDFITLELHKILELLANECSSSMSKNLAFNLRPCNDITEVKKELNKTDTAFNLSVRFGTPIFHNIFDVTDSVKLADSGASLPLKELLKIKDILIQSHELISYRKQFADEETSLDYLFDSIFSNEYLEKRLQSSILNEEELNDDASPELLRIRKKINQSSIKIRENLEKMIRSKSTQKYLQEAIITVRDGRFVIPVKTENKSDVPGLIHATSGSGSTIFVEPISVVEANNDIQMLIGEERDEINRIISELSSLCAEFKEQLYSNLKAIKQLDLYFSKANLGAKMNAIAPNITDSGEIVLKKARHPLIDKNKVVPIDFNVGNENRAVVITGPNTGGKTVILKTVGLLTLMSMCGLLIPVADGSVVSIFDKILVDIGDSQSIEQSLSTFSSHMNNVIHILKVANTKSLVLLDELGSGTDPVEGAALAVSIINRLKKNGAEIVTTTHYQELKMYALETDGIVNASCEFDTKTLQPTYKLIFGTPGKSNAFEIALKLGMDKEIIESSKKLINDENMQFENILEKLEIERQKYERNRTEAEKLKREVSALKSQLEAERNRLEENKQKILDRATREANAIVSRVTRQSDALIDELDALRKQKNKEDFEKNAIKAKQHTKNAINKLYNTANPVDKDKNKEYKLPRPLKKGDSVIITETNGKGIVVSLPDSNGFCYIQAGIMKTKIHISKLRLDEESITLNNKKITSKVSTKNVQSVAERSASMELDIRGYTVDEGIYEVDRFIDNAIMSHIGVITIIHGKGTGALKSAVREHLRHHKQVKSSRRGVYGEGEDGVTVVELK